MEAFDLVVIGSGPAGQRAAVQAAKLGKSVAVIERYRDVGGVCINTGTVPSKTMREAVIDLSGLRQRILYGDSFRAKSNITAADLVLRTDSVMRREREVIRAQLQRNGVKLIEGFGHFVGPHEVVVTEGAERRQLRGDRIVIAVGTRPAMPPGIEVDHRRVITSDDVLNLSSLPRHMAVVGAGIIGLEYASMFATLGVHVTLIDKRTQLLDFVDREMIDHFAYQARAMGVTLRMGEEVEALESGDDDKVALVMKSGKRFATELVLVSAGREGATNHLNLEAAELESDERGRIRVNEHFQTSQPHIYAVGDVIGYPSLASTSSEQGRLAACHAFGEPAKTIPELYPFGIYAIPEISWVGKSEQELTQQGIPYETGVARYKEIARGNILGDLEGIMKLIFHMDTRRILGVWCMGTNATELVHIGQAVMAHDGTLDYFVRSVFNYPTLAECYKVAALDGYNKLRNLGVLSTSG
jgi:NAD(P) transhydrogenase